MDTAFRAALDGRDFGRICRSLDYLDAHWREQPSLQAMADAAGLSATYFNRLFHAWAGLTPKAYLQQLTAAAARRSLRERRSLLDTALEVGLSGPARLHDLIVKLEAMTPAEYAREAEGMSLVCGVARSPFGWLLSAETARGLCHLGFMDSAAREPALATLRAQWPRARLVWQPDAALALQARLWTDTTAAHLPLRLLVRGSRFQLKIWQALLSLPAGAQVSYSDLAGRTGAIGAARATGGAVGANPIAWLIPCHRVLRADGALGGYRWGPERKRAMLAWERLRAAPATQPSSSAMSFRGSARP
jgi:AraC family transcriptional regulator of adaptative response/methylated-DNA-[protein]-cysteine methyltransferase